MTAKSRKPPLKYISLAVMGVGWLLAICLFIFVAVWIAAFLLQARPG